MKSLYCVIQNYPGIDILRYIIYIIYIHNVLHSFYVSIFCMLNSGITLKEQFTPDTIRKRQKVKNYKISTFFCKYSVFFFKGQKYLLI